MDHPHSYTYPYHSTGHHSCATSHGTSSAFSASANPNEDWTKISDLAERRRIQNRIAQRNYRKKLKRRLEDLERRAASSSASPEQSHPGLATADEQDQETKRARLSRQSSSTTPIKRCLSPEPSLDDFPLLNDEPRFMFGQQEYSHYSSASSPAFAYAPYPPADTTYYGAYSQPGSVPMSQGPYFDNNMLYVTSLQSTLPIMPSSWQNVKQDAHFPEDDLLGPFSMTYASQTGIDVSHSQAYSDASAQTPSLTDSHSFDHSRENSPLLSQVAFPSPPSSSRASPPLPLCSVR